MHRLQTTSPTHTHSYNSIIYSVYLSSCDLHQFQREEEKNHHTVFFAPRTILLSDNIGQQCESIVRLTELFDKFQFPVFVNTGFLRLARLFQNGYTHRTLHHSRQRIYGKFSEVLYPKTGHF